MTEFVEDGCRNFRLLIYLFTDLLQQTDRNIRNTREARSSEEFLLTVKKANEHDVGHHTDHGDRAFATSSVIGESPCGEVITLGEAGEVVDRSVEQVVGPE